MTFPRVCFGFPLGAFLWFALLLSPTALAQPSDVVLDFDEGVRLYEAEEYVAALESFQTAESSGQESAALYYNIGNTYYRLNQLGRAILYYERALRLEPTNPLILHSIRVARERTVDRFSRVPDPVWTSTWKAVVRVMRPDGLFALGLLLYLFGIGLAAQRIWTGAPNDWIRRGRVVGLALGMLLLVAGIVASRQRDLHREAVVLHTSTQVLSEPDARTSVVVSVHEGLVVETIEETDGWARVRLPNGVTGWIETQSIAAL